MERQPGPQDFQSPEELKWTPNTAMEMRFGRRGESRPQHTDAQVVEDKKPVNLWWARRKTEVIFGGLFALIALAMVGGALFVIAPSGGGDAADEAPGTEAPADAAPAGEAEEELQGGVKVRKGLGG